MRPNKDEVIEGYNSGLNASKLSDKYDISIWSIYKLLKKHGVQRRTPAQSNKLVYDNKPLTFNKKINLTRDEEVLFNAGLLIYLGEGSKRADCTVDLANSNPEMVKIFLKFLRDIYRVNESKLRVLLYCYSNQNVDQLVEYWSSLSNIPREQFSKPYIREDYSREKYGRMEYGLVHIRYSDTKLMSLIKKDMSNLIDLLLGYPSGQRGLTVDRQL